MAYTAAEIATLEGRLALYLEAEAAVLRNQSYEMPDGRKLTRASLDSVRAEITKLRAEIDVAKGAPKARGRMRRGVALPR